MTKHPPSPIHLRIDTQEQRSGIPDLLAAMPQVHIEVTPLRMGDYDVGGDPHRVFERKTGYRRPERAPFFGVSVEYFSAFEGLLSASYSFHFAVTVEYARRS